MNSCILPDINIPVFNYSQLSTEIFQNIFKIIGESHPENLNIFIDKITEYVRSNYGYIENNNKIFAQIKLIFDNKDLSDLWNKYSRKKIFDLINLYKETKDPYIIFKKNLSLLRIYKEPIKKIDKMKNNNLITKENDKIDESSIFDNISKIQNNLFFYIEKQLNEVQFNNLLKWLYLFNLNIINDNEFIILAKDILIFLNKNTLAAIRNSLDEKKNYRFNPFLKNNTGIQNNDFKELNISYKKKDEDVINISLSKRNINHNYINNNYFCSYNLEHNITSEDNNLKKQHKNIYEENMLKCENERFEFDVNIAQFRVVLQWSNKIKNSKNIIEKEYYIEKIKKFKIFELIFGNNKINDLYSILKTKEDNYLINEIIRHINNKLEILIKNKEINDTESWLAISQKNFYKSLDIKSYSLKNLEKNLISNRNFFNDIKHKNDKYDKLLNLLEPKEKILDNMNYLNSLEELIKTDNCNNCSDFEDLYKNVDLYNNNNLNFISQINLNFEDKGILKDILEILLIGLLENKYNENDRNKNIKFVLKFFKDFFNIKLNEIKFSNDNKYMLNTIKLIEENNNNKTFSYYNNIIEILKNNQNEDDLVMFKKELNIENKNLREFYSEYNEEKRDEINYNFEDCKNNLYPQKTDSNDKILYLNVNYYWFLRYLYYFYERIKKANNLCKINYGSLKEINVYEIYKNLVSNFVTSNISSLIFEETVKIMFENNCGIFLNLEKIFNLIIKFIPNEDLINYLNDLNNSEFDNSKEKNYSETLRFHKINYKLNELINNKGVKQQIGNNLINSNYNKIFRVYFKNNKFYISKKSNIYKNNNIKDIESMFNDLNSLNIKANLKNLNIDYNNYYIKNNIKYNIKVDNDIHFNNTKIYAEDQIFKIKKSSNENKEEIQSKKIMKMRNYLDKTSLKKNN